MSNLLLSAMIACALGGEECPISSLSPIGLVNQHGYNFDYQSGVGSSPSGKFACLLYRARNKPSSQLTTLEWKEDASRKSMVLLQALIEACPSGKCPWDEAILPTTDDIDVSGTHLGFGANSNQHKVAPAAFRRKVKPTRKWISLTTILRRVFGEPPNDERDVVMGIRVTSSVEGDKAPFVLRYTIAALERDNTYEIFPRGQLAEGTLGIIWENVPRDAFMTQLKAMDFPRLTANRREITLRIPANEFRVSREKKLRIIQKRGDQVRTILATTAAAYIPRNPE